MNENLISTEGYPDFAEWQARFGVNKQVSEHDAIVFCLEFYVDEEIVQTIGSENRKEYLYEKCKQDTKNGGLISWIRSNEDDYFDKIDEYMLNNLDKYFIEENPNCEIENKINKRFYIWYEQIKFLEDDARCEILPGYKESRENIGNDIIAAITKKDIKVFCSLTNLNFEIVSRILFYKKDKVKYLLECAERSDIVLLDRYVLNKFNVGNLTIASSL
jgi:hypothetical protein